MRALRRTVELSNSLSWMVASLGCGLAAVGRITEAREQLDELNRRAASEYVPAYALAMLHAFLGEEPLAVAAIERALIDGDPALVWLRVETGPLVPMGIPAGRLNPVTRAALVERLGLNRT